MKQKRYHHMLLVLFMAALPAAQSLYAQTDDQTLAATILHQDSLFWVTYNSCDIAGNKQFFTTDVVFYHDKGGLTLGAENLSAALKKNLCSTTGYRLRRAAVAPTVHVFPLRNATGIYGAILSGEHVFYVTEPGKKERLDGQAKFTHVWTKQDSAWKMTRILSYDHRPAEFKTTRSLQAVPEALLKRYAGTYKCAKSGIL